MSRWLALVVTSAILLLSPPAIGAEVKVEGILKAVDAKERTLTVEKKSAKGTKELSLEVAEEAGDLASLKVGDEVTLAYDSTLEVVTKIISPVMESTDPEVLAVKELGIAGHPWLTKDGLAIYFSVKESQQTPSTLWMAKRANPQALFKDRKQVSLGLDCTFSEDGLEGIVFLPEEGKGTLQQMRRKSVTEDFGRPTLIKELGTKELGGKNDFVVCPGLSTDGLTLYCEVLGQGACFCTRTKPTDPWSKPKKLPIVIGDEGNHRFPYVTDDGMWLFCTASEKLALYGRDKPSAPFVFKGYLKADGTPLTGEFPRYVSATKELFFVKRNEGRPEILVVKNFDPLKVTLD